MPVYLEIDKETKVELSGDDSYVEGEVAGGIIEKVVKIEELTEISRKAAKKIREGLSGVNAGEVTLEIGFAAGVDGLVLKGEGNIKITLKWNP